MRHMQDWITGLMLLFLLLIVSACTGSDAVPTLQDTVSGQANQLGLGSDVFAENETIPVQYTCDGENISPPLSWLVPPEATRSLVLIVADPDAPAGTWVHWVLYDIPPALMSLPEGLPKDEVIPEIGTQGVNDFGELGYGGPCPPGGNPHRYFFKLYALDTMLNMEPGATAAEVETAMQGYVLEEGQLVGLYGR